MSNSTKAVVAGLMAALIAGLVYAGTRPVVQGPPGQNGQDGKSYGALAGPDIASPYLSWGGVQEWHGRTDSLNAASTTACSIQSPIATSTLLTGSGVRFSVSSTTATTVSVYKAAMPATATTFLFGASLAANAQGTVVATTTTDNFVIAPSQWINVVLSGGTGTFSPSGVCEVRFVTI